MVGFTYAINIIAVIGYFIVLGMSGLRLTILDLNHLDSVLLLCIALTMIDSGLLLYNVMTAFVGQMLLINFVGWIASILIIHRVYHFHLFPVRKVSSK